MTDSIAVWPTGLRVLDATGTPVADARLKFYDAQTTDPKTVYSDSALTTALGSTVYTDSGGYPVASQGSTNKVQIYVGSAAYKLEIEDSAGADIVAPLDDIKGAIDTSVFSTEFAKPQEPVLSETSSRAIASTDYGKVINANSTGGSIALTFDAAATVGDGNRVRFRKDGAAGTVSITTSNGELIDGPQGSNTSYQLTRDGEEVLIICTGAGFIASALYIPDGSVTAAQLSSAISGTFMQTGSILIWPIDGALPTGYLDADGSAVSRTTYSELFAVYAEKYGSGDGSTTFNLPNYSGNFLRGWDNGAGVDPDAASRTDRGDGTTGDAVGTGQAYGTESHTHPVSGSTNATTGSFTDTVYISGLAMDAGSNFSMIRNVPTSQSRSVSVNGSSFSVTSSASGTAASETRPVNVGVRFIIFAGVSAATGASSTLNTLLHGSGTPNDALGNDDDFYIDIDNWKVFGPKTAGSWSGTGYRFALTSQGAWATTTAYLVNDFVSNGSSSYVCISAHTAGVADDEPGVGADTATYWNILATGTAGTPGADGTDPGYRWTFDSGTTMTGMSTGELRLNNATLSSVTGLAFHYNNAESGNPSVETVVKSWDDSTTTSDRGRVLLKVASAPQNYAEYKITSAITDDTASGQFTVEHVGSAGALTGTLSVQFYRSGNEGASGGGTGDLVSTNNLSDVASAATSRTNLGVAIGSDVQAYDAELQALSGLGSAADKLPYFTGSGTADLANFSAFGRTLVDDAAAVNARTTLGLAIGTDVQAQDAALQSLANLPTAADKMPYTTASDTYATTDLTAFARTILDDANEAAFKATVNLEPGTDVQAQDAGLQSIADLTTVADKMIYTQGADNYATTDLTSFARSILDDADEATFKATTNLQIGTDVQGFDQQLSDIAGLTYAQGDILYYNGTNIDNLGPGSSGQFLKTQGAAANPVWDTIAGGGDLLASNNLSDVANATTARTNIGAGTGDGDVVGPASATDNALAQFDGTTGKLLSDGPSMGTSANNVLQLDGSGNLPAVGGAALTSLPAVAANVVQTVDTTNRSTTSTSYVDSGVSVTITPSATSSDVKIEVCGIYGTDSTGIIGQFSLYRGTTALTPSGVNGFQELRTIDDNDARVLSFSYVDSPSTTSATTYHLRWKALAAVTLRLGRRGANTTIDSPTIMTATEVLQ